LKTAYAIFQIIFFGNVVKVRIHPSNQSINQSINRPIISPSINISINQIVKQSNIQSINHKPPGCVEQQDEDDANDTAFSVSPRDDSASSLKRTRTDKEKRQARVIMRGIGNEQALLGPKFAFFLPQDNGVPDCKIGVNKE
jgi:hypothetical protein